MKKVAFLNGDLNFHDDGHKMFFDHLNSEGVHVDLIDNLFSQPEKLEKIKEYDTIVVGSTGFDKPKLNKLFEKFGELNYVPPTIIFAPDEDPFISMAFTLSGLTTFYRLSYMNLELIPLNYLNT